jgi:tetratricopeptide (TPR) repeat protein
VDKSLVVMEQANGRAYYRMLETIRVYAADKLNVSTQADLARRRHLAFLVQLAEMAEIRLRGPEQSRWLADLDMVLDNVRAALAWSLTQDAQSGLRLVGALAWYWNLRGYWREGLDWLSKLLARPEAATPTAGRAKALTAAGNLACWGSNDYPQARAWLEESIAIYRQLAPPEAWGLGFALSLYGETLIELKEMSLAQAALDESLAIADSLGEAGAWVAGWALLSLGSIAKEPALQQAQLEQSATLFCHLGDMAQYSVLLARLAWFYIGQKEYSRAQEAAAESLALTEQIGDPVGMAWMYQLLGDLWLAQSNYEQARFHYQAGLERFRTVGSKSGIGSALFHLGRVHLAEGDPVQARAVWQEAMALLEQIGHQETAARIATQLAQLDLLPNP